MTIQQRLEARRQMDKLQNEIERFENLKYDIKKKPLHERSEEENKFMDDVDEAVMKLEKELYLLNQN